MLNIKNVKELEDKKGNFDVDKFIEKSVFEKNNVDSEILNKAKSRVKVEYLMKRVDILNKTNYFKLHELTAEEISDCIKVINTDIYSLDLIIRVIKNDIQDYFINTLGSKDLNVVQVLAEQRVNDLTKKYGIKVDIVDCYANVKDREDIKDDIAEDYKDNNSCCFLDLNEIYYNEEVDWIDLKQLKMQFSASLATDYDKRNKLLVRNIDFMICHEYAHLIIDKYDLLNNRELQHIYYNTHHRGFREYVRDDFEEFLADCFAYSVIDKQDRLKVADTFISKINEIICK